MNHLYFVINKMAAKDRKKEQKNKQTR